MSSVLFPPVPHYIAGHRNYNAISANSGEGGMNCRFPEFAAHLRECENSNSSAMIRPQVFIDSAAVQHLPPITVQLNANSAKN
jgi:hypothetical protein